MNNTKHTPGPWFVEYGKNHEQHRVYGICAVQKHPNSSHHTTIVETDGGYYPPDFADARLIAAAPDLLAALELVYSNAGESPEWIRSKIIAAIEKATGGAE